MIYEQRIYTCNPGKLPLLNKRFETVTLKLWQKHGIRPVAFFTTLVGEDANDLTYLIAWESMAEREKKWNTFAADPEWLAARAESERDGPLLARIRNQFLAPTAYSEMK
jgi:hypothetical protein